MEEEPKYQKIFDFPYGQIKVLPYDGTEDDEDSLYAVLAKLLIKGYNHS